MTLETLKKNLSHTKLKRLGFKPIKEASMGYRKVYTKAGCRYIVKCHCMVAYPPRKHPLATWIVYPSYKKAEWIIQRKVETHDACLAADLVCDNAGIDRGEHDIHGNNCGWLGNKPVCFDPIFGGD